jgi:chitin synthase
VIISFIQRPIPIIPLLLLATVLGLPAILILLTAHRGVYVGWMLVYLASLPIWNFVLPAYAFWHFDDFSWGQTRMVEGEKKGSDHGRKEGEFDYSRIVRKLWVEYERERLQQQQQQQYDREQQNYRDQWNYSEQLSYTSPDSIDIENAVTSWSSYEQ